MPELNSEQILSHGVPAWRPEALDVIGMDGFTVHGPHGVLEQEKIDGHDFRVDCRLSVDTRSAGREDALDRTVSYADVAAIIQDVIDSPSVDLIEALAARIAERIHAEHPMVRSCMVRISKPTAPIDMRFDTVFVQIQRDAPPVRAILAVGSNMGDRAAYLQLALQELERAHGIDLVAASATIETDPVGGVEQDSFLNAAIAVDTTLSPWQLLDLAQHIEQVAQRRRIVRWGPRTLDVDVITWGELQLNDPALTLPHPRAHERAFVLHPLADLEERLGTPITLPGRSRGVPDLLADAQDRDGIRPGIEVVGYPSAPAGGPAHSAPAPTEDG
ncbi:2-amino-4-hydroxy-6-hydroxymethyldihydropteridine diphosphokinase [Helcobacillus massiliensis]|uniref:2-amino-4-hydroxy-6- hydroxymethyldihydropteridine diphosphokinase n=1 Tax=Helcobacillus massiliensis TaxID=521392 RepID=UPI0021A8A89D|nr:2-amino-4-hydroxy-6-hydroxymethyldihydropteridine diphosphokinase [Helcobacillus massiliensis]MCT1558253.1 2-amino-4-hydroxy-6-hydroxymethyldihydropteridine diphosphokinase [Helcobacillus massiliensis]MCT2035508.1 2-amino-4-hydroxy-6-hydroxymethyldihydropteridine diphosphokinase [Helcobacillus massiliensis]MCT2331997.1 2-amino-4-hydroxy-6-hydroxymethyldihydropteridine diphosphokinase [Helcobacillus massiliensis]